MHARATPFDKLYCMISSTLSSAWCKVHGAVPLNASKPYKVAVCNDCDEFLHAKLQMELDSPVVLQKVTQHELRRLQNESTTPETETILSQGTPPQSTSWESEPIVNLVENLLEEAFRLKATDIHLEPTQKNFRIRLRQDGLLNDYKELPLWVTEPVLVRLKVLSEIDITDKRIPHDGSFSFNSSRGYANIRVSTLPVQGGEKCVLRLLPQGDSTGAKKLKGLAALSLSEPATQFLRQIFHSPQGLFLVTGPTGSGKTTTLHAGLEEILHGHLNVTTVEDPIEYELDGANQVQVNEKCGFTFAKALRSILRQDPDVIMVGEIRDQETAQIAFRAAQTGHLVVSTLHTNSSKAAYTRLKDLGIPENMINESILGIMAQRLLRRFSVQTYSGRVAVVEILRPDGTYVDGNLHENARKLVEASVTNEDEVKRVLGFR